MTQQTINNGDTGLAARTKINENFTEVYPRKGVIFSEELDFSGSETYYNRGAQTTALSFSEGVSPISPNVYVYTDLLTNGDAISFPSAWREIKNDYANDVAIYGLIVYWDGTDHQYQMYKIHTPDTIAPTLNSGTVEDASKTTIDLIFDEAVNITTLGWSINTDGAALSILSVSGSGTAAPHFTLSRDIVTGETITLDYNSSAGGTEDLEGNELVTFNAFAVTNNVLAVLSPLTLQLDRMTKVSSDYLCDGDPAAFCYAYSNETFAGDFDIRFTIGEALVVGRNDSWGLDVEATFDGKANWVVDLFQSGPGNLTLEIAGTPDASKVITVGIGEVISFSRSGSTITVTNLNTLDTENFTGSFSQTLRFKYSNYGSDETQPILYNPVYV